MKAEAKHIVGKTIYGIVIKTTRKKRGSPVMSLFLCFNDDTNYEFFTDHCGGLRPTGGVGKGGLEWVLKYMQEIMHPVQIAYLDNDGTVKNIYNPPHSNWSVGSDGWEEK